jgi:hypothetical protein
VWIERCARESAARASAIAPRLGEVLFGSAALSVEQNIIVLPGTRNHSSTSQLGYPTPITIANRWQDRLPAFVEGGPPFGELMDRVRSGACRIVRTDECLAPIGRA